MNEMKTVGRCDSQTSGARAHKKGFSEELNKFFHLIVEFRRDKVFIPRGVFKFMTFEEAEKWRHRMLRGQSPGHQR